MEFVLHVLISGAFSNDPRFQKGNGNLYHDIGVKEFNYVKELQDIIAATGANVSDHQELFSIIGSDYCANVYITIQDASITQFKQSLGSVHVYTTGMAQRRAELLTWERYGTDKSKAARDQRIPEKLKPSIDSMEYMIT